MDNLHALPADYQERVYAGVLGKLIGVYLGRPFEGWSHERILKELGEVDQYVHEKLGTPLVVTDDDVAGTFTFLRALEDSGYDPNLTPAQIGDAWLNYLIEKKTILWWGGLGMSTENTAYMRLKHGVRAPESGSIATNGKTIAEQIGAQIFIDGWAMLFPGDPEAAVDFAGRAGSVSHDGEAVYGAQSIAAMEAMAFVEQDVNVLLDTAEKYVPADSIIRRVIHDVRNWSEQDSSWYDTLARIQGTYGYDKYLGACHMVPNHALIIMALVWGKSDFRQSQMIVNTAGWDTDCNAGNVGAILGIKDGLETFSNSGYDFRTPIADRLYLSTAEGGRAIGDAVQETLRIVQASSALHGEAFDAPEDGARFHFSLPGSVQGFMADNESGLQVSNANGKLRLEPTGDEAQIATTPTFIPEEARDMKPYRLIASPTLHSGQTVTANVSSPDGEATVALIARKYGEGDAIVEIEGPSVSVASGETATIEWMVPDTNGQPILNLGLKVSGGKAVEVDSISWSGAPTVSFNSVTDATMWRQAWVDGVQNWSAHWMANPYTLGQDEGIGLLSQGTEDWTDYEVSAQLSVPLAASAGITGRVGGMKRYYAFTICNDDTVKITCMNNTGSTLAEAPFKADPDTTYAISFKLDGDTLIGAIDGKELVRVQDSTFEAGAAGFLIEEGTLIATTINVKAV